MNPHEHHDLLHQSLQHEARPLSDDQRTPDMTVSSTSQTRRLAALTWLLRVLIGIAFIFFALMKLSSQPRMVAEFAHVGLGQWFRYFTGSLELIGGISVLIPRVSALGAALLLVVVGGAFGAQLMVLHGDVIHAIIIALLLATLIYLQRSTPSAVRLSKA